MSERNGEDGSLTEQLQKVSLWETNNSTTRQPSGVDTAHEDRSGQHSSNNIHASHRYNLRSHTRPTGTASRIPANSLLDASAQTNHAENWDTNADHSRPASTKKLGRKPKAAARAVLQDAIQSPNPASGPGLPSSPPKSFPRGKTVGDVGVKQPSSYLNPKAPRLQMLERPVPTPLYFQLASQALRVLPAPRPLLVVVDLNGTLLKRSTSSRTNFTPRPHLYDFLSYVLVNHKLMIWSSARPDNVAAMCAQLFTPKQHQQLVAIWARDKLRLTTEAYNEKVQVYKQLSWIWNDTKIQATNPAKEAMWDQSNTVLIDDSIEKAASEPNNLIELAEFDASPEQIASDTSLKQMMHYLSTLSYQVNVSAYVQRRPFQPGSHAALTV